MALCCIVEDHGDTREGYAEYLMGCGYDVRTVGDSAGFWRSLDYAVPDVILMDLRLPEVDGWTLTRLIREDPRTSRVPVVVISASVRDEDRARAFESGADAFLPKPCGLDEIVREMERLLRRPADKA